MCVCVCARARVCVCVCLPRVYVRAYVYVSACVRAWVCSRAQCFCGVTVKRLLPPRNMDAIIP